MTAIVIAEKPSQARDIIAAVGNSYGVVLAAQGHLLALEEPDAIKPEWAKWNDDLLMPPSGRYALVPDRSSGKGPRLDAIKNALRTATEAVIATDCDREGQAIGQSALLFFGFRGRIKRAMFTAQDPTSLQAAFAKLEDNSKYENLYQAAVARSQADQIYNLTLTRVATNNLRKQFGDPVIGIGRVKTPTLGIVCKRELEIRNFKETDYFEVSMVVQGAAGKAKLLHAPAEDARILDRKRAEAIVAAARAFTGPVVVETKRKKQSPPRPMDLPTLQKRAAKFGWTAKRTLDTAQELYATHKIITYPRAESRYLPENMIPDAGPLLGLLKQLPDYRPYSLAKPEIRTGKSGVWSDKALEGISHHAIIPNINCPGGFASVVPKLSADEKKLFDLIARSFLAAIGEDRIYDHTTISATVATPAPSPCLFKTTGSVTLSPGFTQILSGVDDDDDPDGAVPPLKNGEIVRATDAAVEARKTKPPPRYSEGSLIAAMQNAWKFLDDPAERDRLKEAKGIGTPATRDTVIDGLKRQNLLTPTSDGKLIAPTEAGLSLYNTLLKAAPILVDPGATARMEQRLDEVMFGRATADQVIAEIATAAGALIPPLQKAGQTMKIANAKTARPKAASLPGQVAKPSLAPRIPKPPKPGLAARPAHKPAAPAARGPTPSSSPSRPSAPPRPAAASATTRLGTALKVPFDRKDEAKALGAKWDSDAKTWYAPSNADLSPFRAKGFT